LDPSSEVERDWEDDILRHGLSRRNHVMDWLVAGFNDKHLEFRVVVDVIDSGTTRSFIATTLALTHSPLGRAYHALNKPFHRLIVPTMLRQIEDRS
jgi:hypothetical protein